MHPNPKLTVIERTSSNIFSPPCDIADESPTFDEAVGTVAAPVLFRSTPPCKCPASKFLSGCNISQLTLIHDFLFSLFDRGQNPIYSRQDLEYRSPQVKIRCLAQRCHGIFHELNSKSDFQKSGLRNIYFKALSSLKTDQIEPFQNEILIPLINATRLESLNTLHQECLEQIIFGFWQSLTEDNLKLLIKSFLIYCAHTPEKMNEICSIFKLRFNPNTISLIEQKKRIFNLTLENNNLAHLACRIMKIIQAKVDEEVFDPAPPNWNVVFTTPPINDILSAIPPGKMPFFMKFIALKLTCSRWRYLWIIETIRRRLLAVELFKEGKALPDSNFNIDAEILSLLTCDWHFTADYGF